MIKALFSRFETGPFYWTKVYKYKEDAKLCEGNAGILSLEEGKPTAIEQPYTCWLAPFAVYRVTPSNA